MIRFLVAILLSDSCNKGLSEKRNIVVILLHITISNILDLYLNTVKSKQGVRKIQTYKHSNF